MNKMNKRNPLVLLPMLAALCAAGAQADLLEYTFQAPDGTQKTLAPGATYANATGNIAFAVSAGVDRKVRVSILRPDQSVVSTRTSDLLGATDRITVGGKSYYGARLELPAPPEGEYRIRTELLSAQGAIVQTENATLVQDITPPVAGSPFFWTPFQEYHRLHTDGKWIVSTYYGTESGFRDVSDAGSGVLRATFSSSYLDGPKAGQAFATNLPVNIGTGDRAVIGTGAPSSIPLAYMPRENVAMRWYFDVTDKAGNTTRLSADVYVANSTSFSAPEPVAIHTGTGPGYFGQPGFAPYTPGMVIDHNPIQMIYRVPRAEYLGGGGDADIYGAWVKSPLSKANTDRVLGVDDTYLYLRIVGATDGETVDTAANYTMSPATQRKYEFTLDVQFASDDLRPPEVVEMQAYVAGRGAWVPSRTHTSKSVTNGQTDAITRLRITVAPRSYIQKYYMTMNRDGGGAPHTGNCTIAAQATSCEVSVNLPFPGDDTAVYHTIPTVADVTGQLRSRANVINGTWYSDGSPATVVRTDVAPEAKRITYHAENNYKQRAWGQPTILTQTLRLVNKASGQEITKTPDSVEVVSIDADRNEHRAAFSYAGVPSGTYDVYADIEDGFPASRQTTNRQSIKIIPDFVVDSTPPAIVITPPGGGALGSLDEIEIEVSDAVTASPTITQVRLQGGPATEDVYLTARAVSPTQYKLEYPVIFPSNGEGQAYTLTVQARDEQNNTASTSVQFTYAPRQVRLADGANGQITLPAVTQEIVRTGGGRAIETEPFTLGDGTVVSGAYDVFATVRSDAAMALRINGVQVDPGQTVSVMSQYDFGASGGRLSLPVQPAVAGVVGSASVLVMTSAPNAPILAAEITTWQGAATLSAQSWEVRQAIDPVRITATAAPGVPCRLTAKESEARAADPIRDPVCLFQWDTVPDEAVPGAEEGVGAAPALVGQAVGVGVQPVTYSLHLFGGDGTRVQVGAGSRDLTVLSAYGEVGYTLPGELAQVTRVIEDLSVTLKQNHGANCALTLSAERALRDAAVRQPGSASRTCLLEWQQIPDGLVQDEYSDAPLLQGTLGSAGSHPIGWRVSTFSRGGTRITLADETFAIEAIDPSVPSVSLLSAHNLKDNIYTAPMGGDYLGDAVVTADRASLDVSISRNAEVLESEAFAPGWKPNNRVQRRIRTDERALWEEVSYVVRAAYTAVPDVANEATYRVVAVPSERIKPAVEVEGTTAIDTQALPVRVLIRDQLSPESGYDAATMGVWRVRLIQQKAYGQTEPLTDFVNASNGEAQFDMDMSRFDTPAVRLLAEAVLESPVEGYSRTVLSARPAFLTVLRGGAIDASVQAPKLSGEAPLTSVFRLALTDNQDARAVGAVSWEVSADSGASWEAVVSQERSLMRFIKTFEKGEYQVRARVTNLNSGAEKYTEAASITAYDKPKIAITGPTAVFVGGEGRYAASVTLDDVPVSADDAVIEWSTDGGQTFGHTGADLRLSSDEVTRYRLWARVRSTSAPADDAYAYQVAKTSVDVVPIKAPRPRLSGPSVIETGKTYTFQATIDPPYRGMDVTMSGFFTLPDGTVVEGDTATYVPTEADLAKATVDTTYTAWVEDFRAEGAEATHSLRSRVWQYVWPRFGLQVKQDAKVAPATVVASVRAIAFTAKLDAPTYEWALPDGVTIQDQRTDTLRAFVVTEPGEHTIRVTVRDARGHESVIEQPLTIDAAPPYVIDLQYSGSNPHLREPLNVLVRPYISGGHPRDRIATRTYTIDGTPIEAGGIYARATLGAGEHSVKLSITSEMGSSAEGELRIPVAENQPPVCALKTRETVGSWSFTASCDDPDGRAKSYEWTVAGDVQSISSNRLTLSKGTYDTLPAITVVGVDDAGARSEPVSP